jgi:MoaA/NifB/PqqE/SkfB family radical SAM enzyme
VHLRERLGWFLTERAYAHSVTADVPRSKWLIASRYATAPKLLNFVRGKVDYYRRRTHVRAAPYSLRIDPTTACNLRCPLCPTGAGEIDRKQGTMSRDMFERVLDQFGHRALIVQLWVWGEPLMNRQIADLIALAEARAIATEISTNLSLKLTDNEIDRLIKAGLTWLIVSIDAASPDTYRRYRRGGDFNLAVNNMRRILVRKKVLGSRTPFVEWQFVPLRHNEHEIADAVKLAKDIGVDGFRLKPARFDKVEGRTFGGQVSPGLVDEWMPETQGLKYEGSTYLDYHCPFLWGSITVHPDGGIAPCCETSSVQQDLARLDDADIDGVWNSPAYVTARETALGRTTAHPEIACHGCRVFKKPEASFPI